MLVPWKTLGFVSRLLLLLLPCQLGIVLVRVRATASTSTSAAPAGAGASFRTTHVHTYTYTHTEAPQVDVISSARSQSKQWYRWRQRVLRLTNQRRIHQRFPMAKAAGGVSSSSSSSSSSRTTKGSILTLQRPTTERVSRWFWGKETVFNHNSVGMTNPCLHIAVTEDDSYSCSNPNHQLSSTAASTATATATALPVVSRRQQRVTAAEEEEEEEQMVLWWPPTACPLEKTSASWRVLRYRRRVGRGAACYQRVRDAALQWEFSSSYPAQPAQPADQHDHDLGMLQVTTPSSAAASAISSNCNQNQQQQHRRGYTVLPLSELDDIYAPSTSDQFMKIWSGPGRRLVTFTRSGLPLPLLPRLLPARFQWMLPCLYAINPVAVVYDLVDKRGPATTYTSTAYATVQGHLLRGEERVTVALRDSGHVDVEIISFSKPAASVKGRLVWPVIGGMQQTFFEQEMRSLERAAQSQGELEGRDMVSNMILRIQ